MKRKYKRMLLGAAVVLVILSGIYYSLAPLVVVGIRLTAGSYSDVLTEEGNLYALRQWNLFAPLNLMVEEVYQQAGDAVQPGTLLLRLDNTMLQKQWQADQNAALIQLAALRGELASVGQQKQQHARPMIDRTLQGIQAQIDGLQAQLDSARRTYENTKQLYEAGYESQAKLEDAALTVKEIESSLNERQSAVALQSTQMETTYSYYAALEESLQEQIQAIENAFPAGETNMQSAQLAYQQTRTSLYAPAGGKVLFLDVKPGDMADITKPIAAVYEEGFAGAEVYLLAADVALVHPGMEAQVIIKGREKEYRPAMVTAVAPYAQERISELGLAESRVKVTLSLYDGHNLIMGQKVDVAFTLESKDEAIAVPKAAVFEYQDGYAVMTAVNNKARLQVIEKEFETDTMTVIKSGLQAGDVVLLSPKQEGLQEGSRIQVRQP